MWRHALRRGFNRQPHPLMQVLPAAERSLDGDIACYWESSVRERRCGRRDREQSANPSAGGGAASTAPARKEQGKLPFGAKVARGALVLLLLVGAAIALLPGGRAVYRAGMLLPSVIISAQPGLLSSAVGMCATRR